MYDKTVTVFNKYTDKNDAHILVSSCYIRSHTYYG